MASTSTLTLNGEQAALIEQALLVLAPGPAVEKLIERVRRAQKRIMEHGQDVARPADADRRAAAPAKPAEVAPRAATVPATPPGDSRAGAATGSPVDRVPQGNERVAPRPGVDRDMRYTDRGAARQRAAYQTRDWYFAPPKPRHRPPWKRVARIAAALLVVGIIVSVFFFSLTTAIREQRAWEKWCHESGGAVTSTSDTRVGVGIGANGQPVTTVTSNTTYYCLADGNRLLGVRS